MMGCNRIAAARACQRFPVILDLLASGDMTLTSVRMLGKHLTVENHEAVLARARRRSRPEIEVLVAELAPRPDVPTSIRRLPVPTATSAPIAPPIPAAVQAPSESTAAIAPPPAPFVPAPRPIVQPTAPQRYRVQFTIGQETYDELQSLQRLLRREIPDGDAGTIFARALPLLRKKVEGTKLGAASRPRPGRVYPPRDGYATPMAHSPATPHPEGGPARGLEAGRRTVCLRLQGRTPVHRADVPGVPPRGSLCAGRPTHGGQHLVALPLMPRAA